MRIMIITNIPAPYRVDFFEYLQNTNIHEFHFVFASKKEGNRVWTVDLSKLCNTHFVRSKTIELNGKRDKKYIHIPLNLIKILRKISPDIIIASEYNPSVVTAFVWAKLNSVKFISWTDGTLGAEKSINRVQKILRRNLVRDASACIGRISKSLETPI